MRVLSGLDACLLTLNWESPRSLYCLSRALQGVLCHCQIACIQDMHEAVSAKGKPDAFHLPVSPKLDLVAFYP